jgi:hypothetical protein
MKEPRLVVVPAEDPQAVRDRDLKHAPHLREHIGRPQRALSRDYLRLIEQAKKRRARVTNKTSARK